MRRTAALCVVAVLLAGCRGDSDDSDTSTAAGGGSSGTTMAMGGAGHTDHLGNPTSACSPAGSSVTITANGTKFDKDCLAARPARRSPSPSTTRTACPTTSPSSKSHTASDVLFRAEIFQGPRTQTFNVGALRPGAYAFHCEVHPAQMSGTFVVK